MYIILKCKCMHMYLYILNKVVRFKVSARYNKLCTFRWRLMLNCQPAFLVTSFWKENPSKLNSRIQEINWLILFIKHLSNPYFYTLNEFPLKILTLYIVLIKYSILFQCNYIFYSKLSLIWSAKSCPPH